MLKNYIKIAVRNLFRNKAYSFINIFGLTLGITCCSLLFMFVIDELTFDDFHSKKNEIHRIIEVHENEEGTVRYAANPYPVGQQLVEDYEEVVESTGLITFSGHIDFSKGETKFQEREYYITDNNFFNVFDFELVQGDPATALKEPNSIVINEYWAKILFVDEDPIGKTIPFDNGQNLKIVTGVMKNVPGNSHIQIKMLLSIPTNEERAVEYLANWQRYSSSTYVVLQKNASVSNLVSQLPTFVTKYFGEDDERVIELQPLSEVHFKSENIQYGADAIQGQMAYIYIFMAIGIFMIVIACINYMNLATAKSMHRGKEIGMRKVSGATRAQLITQFLSESTLISMISFGLSVGLVDLILPYFNQITDKAFLFNMETFSGVFGLLFIITLVVGLLSGSYPALLMSKLHPAGILKGEMNTGRGSLMIRKVLVITQFSLSIIMIIATVVASKQMDFIQNRSLGFDNSQIMVIDINNSNVRNRFETMKNEFSKSPYIENVAVSSRVPGEWKNIREVYINNVASESVDSIRTFYIGFDKDMIAAYNMEIVAGNNFSGNLDADSLTIMINEKTVEVLGLVDPIGASIHVRTGRGGGQYRVVGVVKDYNFQSLHNEIGPMIMGYRSNVFQGIDYFTLKIKAGHTQEVLAHATNVHNMFDENTAIEYHFLDQQWAEFYKNDQRAGDIFMIGAGITILIACMGLFGLASFIVQKRTKEIGVRKVLGASIPQLFILLSKTFVIQVGISFLIAAPISWYFMSEWLSTFAFKFGMGASEFLMAGAAALFIALGSVSYRVIKAATLNPATTLKDE